jgi:hypothetical protein
MWQAQHSSAVDPTAWQRGHSSRFTIVMCLLSSTLPETQAISLTALDDTSPLVRRSGQECSLVPYPYPNRR